MGDSLGSKEAMRHGRGERGRKGRKGKEARGKGRVKEVRGSGCLEEGNVGATHYPCH